MKFINFAIVKFSVFLVLGITAAHIFPFLKFSVLPLLVGSFLLLGIVWWVTRNRLQPSILFGGLSFLSLFWLGYFNYQARLPFFQDDHYVHYFPMESTSEHAVLIQLKVTEVLKPDRYNHKYMAQLIALDGNKTSGKILVSIAKDSLPELFQLDTTLLVSGFIQEIPPPLNPHQFDYAQYMKTLSVHGQIRLKHVAILSQQKGKQTLRGHAERLRNFAISKLKKSNLQPKERAIVQALILGQRSDISKELTTQYAAAGAIHILAVSGLHVGIVFMMGRFLLGFLDRFRAGKRVKALLLILLLFGFALLAGLSPSVVRAATMFSLFIFAEQTNRPTSSINTLFLSFFGLLLINPLWLFSVGFQLSYLAVFFILWIQPKLFAYYRPKTYVVRLFWSIISVTIAAQLGILPLSLYYFHQFPGLFLITNLVILPALSVILIGGILVLLLAMLEILPLWLSSAYNFAIECLNAFVAWVASQNEFLFEDISFSAMEMTATYLIIISIVLLWKQLNYHRLVLTLVSCSVFFGIELQAKLSTANSELIIFHKSRKTLVGIKQGRRFVLFTNDSIRYRRTFPIKGYRIACRVRAYQQVALPKVFLYKNKKVLVLDSLGIYPKNSNIDLVLLTESPRVNLTRLIDSLKPKLIVADGSNYRSYVARWEKTCKKKKLPFHHTGNKGALIFE